MIWFILISQILVILALLLYADRVQRRGVMERNERLRYFLKTLQDRQEEFISLTEVLLREATEHPISIRRSSEIVTGSAETPTWGRKKPSDAFVGKDANPRSDVRK